MTAAEETSRQTLDTLTLMRSLATVFVVIGHYGVFEYGGGAVYALLFLAGMTFALYKIPGILRTGRVASIYVLLTRVVLLTWATTAFTWLMTGYGEWLGFSLIDNFFRPNVAGSKWFIPLYVQTLVLVSVALLAPAVRRRLVKMPFVTAMIASAAAIFIMYVSESNFDFHHLYRRLPHLLIWLFLCGAAMAFANTSIHRVLVAILALVGWVGFGGNIISFFSASVIFIAVLREMPAPALLVSVFRQISNASLMIYLTHLQIRGIMADMFEPSPAVALVIAIFCGVILWRVYLPFDLKVRRVTERLLGMVPQHRATPPV